MNRARPDIEEILALSLPQIFRRAERNIHVHMETPRLALDSVTPADADAYYERLFGHSETMKTYDRNGEARTRQQVIKKIDEWVARLTRGGYPYSAMAVRLKDADEIIGNVMLGWGHKPHLSELSYIFNCHHWGQGYGTEACFAVVGKLAPELIRQNYKVMVRNERSDDDWTFYPLERIVAVASKFNPASVRILQHLCDTFGGNVQKREYESDFDFSIPVPRS